MLCCWGVKAGMACLQVKLCVIAIVERFRKYNWYFKTLYKCPGLLYFLLQTTSEHTAHTSYSLLYVVYRSVLLSVIFYFVFFLFAVNFVIFSLRATILINLNLNMNLKPRRHLQAADPLTTYRPNPDPSRNLQKLNQLFSGTCSTQSPNFMNIQRELFSSYPVDKYLPKSVAQVTKQNSHKRRRYYIGLGGCNELRIRRSFAYRTTRETSPDGILRPRHGNQPCPKCLEIRYVSRDNILYCIAALCSNELTETIRRILISACFFGKQTSHSSCICTCNM